MSEICRLCLNDAAKPVDEEISDDTAAYRTQIELLMPEIDLNITAAFALCSQCSFNLNSAYKFKSECLRIEQLINDYRKELDAPLIDLREIKKQQLSDDGDELISVSKVKIEECDESVDLQSINTGITGVSLICDKCDEVFNNENIFQQHIESCDSNIECKTESRFEDESVGENLDTFICKYCRRSFTTSAALKSHLRTHLKRPQHMCDTCCKVFKTKRQYEEHLFSHTGKKRYFCKVCNKGYNRMYTLQTHEEIHKNKKFDCSMCMKSFPSRRYLKRHQLNSHLGTHICKTCGIKCGTSYALKEHLRSHTGDRPYKCEVCGKGFAQSGTLSVHIRSRHIKEKPFVCEICGKAFAFKASLKGHTTTHMDIPKNFTCYVDGCNKTFRTAPNLRDHVRRHNLPKDFKCSICEKGFKDITALRRHLRTHTGEKPYECGICHKTFSEKYNLETHFKSHRSKKNKMANG